MSHRLKCLLFEAYRRNDMADEHERSKPLLKRWLGLGTEAAYREALESGLMRFHDDQKPPPRCMGWLCLTETGIDALLDNAPQFAAVLEQMKRDQGQNGKRAYANSYRANYMLAGGITQ